LQGGKPGILGLYVQIAVDAGEGESEIPPDQTIPPESTVHFGALQKDARIIAHQADIEGYRGLGVRLHPFAVLLEVDHWFSRKFKKCNKFKKFNIFKRFKKF
jgi:hypothetical protein